MSADGGKTLEGTTYGRQRAVPNALLTQVGPGTPCGEFMRRYWQPLLPSADVTNRPKEIRILSEDLIVFRDKAGRVGLLYPRCMHRGTTLFYGRVEKRGIRCCYHGWLFDVEGNCLEQPCEPGGGKTREAARQPWYPVRERYGLLWTYMGPPEKLPVLPRYDVLENLEPGENYLADTFGVHGDARDEEGISPCSWMHMNDNVMDPFHVQQLHSTISTTQFVPHFAIMPKVEFEYIDGGVIYRATRNLPDGREVERISTWMLPHAMSVPSPALTEGRSDGMGFTVPVDDTHSRNFMVLRRKGGGPLFNNEELGLSKMKPWCDMTVEERQLMPGDYEAQVGQGPVSLHSEEHLATSDRGVAMQRRMLEQQIRKVMEGGDPQGVAFTEADALVRVPSGNFYRKAGAAAE